jgi:hypothetical protein
MHRYSEGNSIPREIKLTLNPNLSKLQNIFALNNCSLFQVRHLKDNKDEIYEPGPFELHIYHTDLLYHMYRNRLDVQKTVPPEILELKLFSFNNYCVSVSQAVSIAVRDSNLRMIAIVLDGYITGASLRHNLFQQLSPNNRFCDVDICTNETRN